jgi:membrane protein
MNWIETLRDAAARIDRERLSAFGRFLWKRFRDDRCFESAGAMAYTTVFALVPLTAAVFGIVSAFPAFQTWLDQLTEFIFSNFVPEAARIVEQYLREFADSARGLTSVGAIALLATALLMLAAVEDTFNRIWRVSTPRPRLARFLVYWTVLTLGPLLALAVLAIWSYLVSLPLLSDAARDPSLSQNLLRLAPILIELAGFTLAYTIIPNRRVQLRHALVGGVLATVLFELAKFGFALYLRQVPSYAQIFGAMAVVPIFLIWIYLSWVVILLGASIASSLSAFRFQPRALRLPPGYEFYGLLRLLGRLDAARERGDALQTAEIEALEPCLTDDLLQRLLASLSEIHVVQRGEEGGWLLSRDPESICLRELYEAARLRLPAGAAAQLPGAEDELGRRAIEAVERLRAPLDHGLSLTLADVLAGSLPAAPDSETPA